MNKHNSIALALLLIVGPITASLYWLFMKLKEKRNNKKKLLNVHCGNVAVETEASLYGSRLKSHRDD